MTTTTATFGEGLAAQADRQWTMLKATIQRITDEQWHAGDNPGQVPAWLALHALLWADFYVQDNPSAFNPKERFGVSDRDEPKSLPGREAILEYVDVVAAHTRDFLVPLDETALLEKETLFPWTGATVLERVLYTFRHTTYHLGELSYVLRVHGADGTEWA